MDEFLIDNPDPTRPALATLVLAHGAGAGMDSEFMNRLAAVLVARRIQVIRFDFPYMCRWRQTGRQRPPDRLPVLLQHWQHVLTAAANLPARAGPMLIGGKSMGGRLATLLAAAPVGTEPAEQVTGVDGICCFGYPFFPRRRQVSSGGKDGVSDKRLAHLGTLATPTLVIQGSRDPFGGPAAVGGLLLSDWVSLQWLDGADHDFMPGRAAQSSRDALMARAGDVAATFATRLGPRRSLGDG